MTEPGALATPADGATGLLLAAGAGRRMGGPKALLRDDVGVTFVERAVRLLLDGGCASVTVVVGAAADEVIDVLHRGRWLDDEPVRVADAADWNEGMGASLRAGLARLIGESPDQAALVTLVDLPDVDARVVRRVLAQSPPAPHRLGRAVYGGRPGHPVLLGRDHWHGVVAGATGDRGARDYLAAHDVVEVECGDLASGRDIDVPDER